MTDPSPPLPSELKEFLDQWRIEMSTRDIYREEGSRAMSRWIEMRERMDYWMAGLAGGALVYALQSYDSALVPIAFWLAPLSWAALFGSVGCGLKSLTLMESAGFAHFVAITGEARARRFASDVERNTLWRRHRIGRSQKGSPEEEANLDALWEQVQQQSEDTYELATRFDDLGKESMDAITMQTRAAALSKWRTRLLLVGLGALALLRLLNLR